MKILLLDIETAPNTVHVWGLWKQNVGINQILESGYVLCWAAKWHGKPEVLFDSSHRSGYKRMIRRIHKLIDEADVVVHYNGSRFDMPTLNRAFIQSELRPPAPYKQVDLLKTMKSQFRFPSNKLDFIARELGLGEKEKHRGHDLWIKCMAKDDEAWAEMERYNRQDVILLEQLYDRVRPWIKNHPNIGTYDEPGFPVCPNCGGSRLQRRGYARTVAGKYSRFQCIDCGTWSREAFSAFRRKDREQILRQA